MSGSLGCEHLRCVQSFLMVMVHSACLLFPLAIFLLQEQGVSDQIYSWKIRRSIGIRAAGNSPSAAAMHFHTVHNPNWRRLETKKMGENRCCSLLFWFRLARFEGINCVYEAAFQRRAGKRSGLEAGGFLSKWVGYIDVLGTKAVSFLHSAKDEFIVLS